MIDILDILNKSTDGEPLSKQDLIHLLAVPPESREGYLILAEGSRLSRELAGNYAEIHAQFALNLAPCDCNCLFCSFATKNKVFHHPVNLPVEEAVEYAKQFEKNGANSIFIMITAGYPLGRFLEISQEIKSLLNPDTVLIANVGDQSLKNARRIKDAGFKGVYHALRLREGKDTGINPEKRINSIRNFQEAGLIVGTCVEPVGPEHTNDELAEMIQFTASIHPAYSGAARRIGIPGTTLEKKGMISELRMAQIVAVTRMAMPRSVIGNCTHEPCTLGACAGANLFWAELGANPRDTRERTEEGRGDSVEACNSIFRESNWDIWKGATRYYQ